MNPFRVARVSATVAGNVGIARQTGKGTVPPGDCPHTCFCDLVTMGKKEDMNREMSPAPPLPESRVVTPAL